MSLTLLRTDLSYLFILAPKTQIPLFGIYQTFCHILHRLRFRANSHNSHMFINNPGWLMDVTCAVFTWLSDRDFRWRRKKEKGCTHTVCSGVKLAEENATHCELSCLQPCAWQLFLQAVKLLVGFSQVTGVTETQEVTDTNWTDKSKQLTPSHAYSSHRSLRHSPYVFCLFLWCRE